MTGAAKETTDRLWREITHKPHHDFCRACQTCHTCLEMYVQLLNAEIRSLEKDTRILEDRLEMQRILEEEWQR